MVDGDPLVELEAYIDERWAVVQPNVFPAVTELRVRLEEVTPNEAMWFLASVTSHRDDPPLLKVEDDNKERSDRYPPNADGARRGNVFFEKSGEKCSLRLESLA